MAQEELEDNNKDNNRDDYRIALYYCYIPLEDLQAVVDFHDEFKNRIAGRVRVASEGLNGVLSGPQTALQDYEQKLREFLTNATAIDSGKAASSSTSLSWELDVKYCMLRSDLTVSSQLFTELEIDKTSSVVGLVDMNDYHPNQRNASSKKGYSGSRRQRRKQERRKFSDVPSQPQRAQEIYHKSLHDTAFKSAAPHLSPAEWNEKLRDLTQQPDSKVVLLDCRNSYESAVGYFQAPGALTILTNTRKYSELPGVLMEQQSDQSSSIATASHIFMYCTGGVRCERASGFLQTLLTENSMDDETTIDGKRHTTTTTTTPQIYQLHGGIQRYLQSKDSATLYYRGKNFVFDPRRTDPSEAELPVVVGQCLVCAQPHDDYDNGHVPAANREARCYQCRILVLVCNACRPIVTCWGDENNEGGSTTTAASTHPRLYCGGLEPKECFHMPPVREIRS